MSNVTDGKKRRGAGCLRWLGRVALGVLVLLVGLVAVGAILQAVASATEARENDFMSAGGDGYPLFSPRVTTQDIMDQVLADYVTANSPLSPFVLASPYGRINCADSNGTTAPNCPVLNPSP